MKSPSLERTTSAIGPQLKTRVASRVCEELKRDEVEILLKPREEFAMTQVGAS
jgi:hypothetical protein